MRNFIFILLLSLCIISCDKEENGITKETKQLTEHELVWVPSSLEDSEPIIRVTDIDDWFKSNVRNGNYDTLFFKESLTTDDYLLQLSTRSQLAYNKEFVDSVKMVKLSNTNINIDGIDHSFYRIYFKYKGSTVFTKIMTALSAGNFGLYVYQPYGIEILSAGYKYDCLKVERIYPVVAIEYGDWYFGKTKRKYKFNIIGGIDTLGTDFLASSLPNGTMFRFNHK